MSIHNLMHERVALVLQKFADEAATILMTGSQKKLSKILLPLEAINTAVVRVVIW